MKLKVRAETERKKEEGREKTSKVPIPGENEVRGSLKKTDNRL